MKQKDTFLTVDKRVTYVLVCYKMCQYDKGNIMHFIAFVVSIQLWEVLNCRNLSPIHLHDIISIKMKVKHSSIVVIAQFSQNYLLVLFSIQEPGVTLQAVGQIFEMDANGHLVVKWADGCISQCYPQEVYIISEDVSQHLLSFIVSTIIGQHTFWCLKSQTSF